MGHDPDGHVDEEHRPPRPVLHEQATDAGPVPAASAAAAPQAVMAAIRQCTGNGGNSSASEVGTRTAAPAVCTSRAAISNCGEFAAPQMPDATVNVASPTAATGPVSRPARRQQECRDQDAAAVEYPGQRGQVRLGERLLDVGERHIDDDAVEEGHERADSTALPARLVAWTARPKSPVRKHREP
jgi:hypothetical protein